jgi:hypothetical protein
MLSIVAKTLMPDVDPIRRLVFGVGQNPARNSVATTPSTCCSEALNSRRRARLWISYRYCWITLRSSARLIGRPMPTGVSAVAVRRDRSEADRQNRRGVGRYNEPVNRVQVHRAPPSEEGQFYPRVRK